MQSLFLVLVTVFSTMHPLVCADLPAPAELFQSVRDHWIKLAEVEAKAYRADWKKDRWADYMPSVGVAYTPSGAPRPGVSFSLGSLIASRKKKREAVRIELRIFEAYKVKADDEVRALKARINVIEKRESARSLDAQLLEIEKLVFDIAQDEFDRAELDPKSYLMAKRKWLIVQADYKREDIEIARLKSDLLVAAYWG